MPGSPAAAIGLVKGDRIVGIDDREVRRFDDLADYSKLRPGEDVVLTVERAGRTFTASTRLATVTEADRFGQTYRVGRLGVATGQRVFEPPTAWGTGAGVAVSRRVRRPHDFDAGGNPERPRVGGSVADIGAIVGLSSA
jgi:membrane-associated protease RseP (regulator of RpoE activity)